MEDLELDTAEVKGSEIEILRTETIETLNTLLNDFSDEIPTEIIHGDTTTTNKRFKVRGNRFGMAAFKIGRLHKKGLLPDSFVSECDLCIQNYHKHHQENGGLTTREDIDTMNDILRRTVEYLQIHI